MRWHKNLRARKWHKNVLYNVSIQTLLTVPNYIVVPVVEQIKLQFLSNYSFMDPIRGAICFSFLFYKDLFAAVGPGRTAFGSRASSFHFVMASFHESLLLRSYMFSTQVLSCEFLL